MTKMLPPPPVPLPSRPFDSWCSSSQQDRWASGRDNGFHLRAIRAMYVNCIINSKLTTVGAALTFMDTQIIAQSEDRSINTSFTTRPS